MNRAREKDEHLERLWYMKEGGKSSTDDLKNAMQEDFNSEIVDELSSEGLVKLTDRDTKITLTQKGEDGARRLIRAHRLAERLLYDILGGEFESGACEFEHTVTPELVDSICTLLGHPRECPHGLPIPEGECCRRSAKTAYSSIVPLTELKVGQSARVAYVNCKNDQRLHKMEGLHIRPGASVKLHQTYPSYVMECEGVNIALDREIVSSICVWREPRHYDGTPQEISPAGTGRRQGKGRGWGRGFGFRRRRRQRGQ